MEIEYIFLIVMISGLLIVTVIFGFSFMYSNNENEKYFKNKSWTIDYANKLVYGFEKRLVNGVTKLTFDEFYSQFKQPSQEKVKTFIETIFENTSNIDSKIECDSLRKIGYKHYYFSILEITSINHTRQILHLNQYYFKNIPLLDTSGMKIKKKTNINNTDKQIEILFVRNKPYSGASFLFELTVMKSDKTNELATYINYKFRDIISKYSAKRHLIPFDYNQYIIHDFKLNKYVSILKLLSAVRNDFNLFLELNQLSEDVRLNIGVVEHKYFPRNYNKVLKYLKSVGHEATSMNKAYMIYDPHNQVNFYFDQSYSNEISSIITNKCIDYLFSPILNIKKEETYGYFTEANPKSSLFTNMDEVKQYAFKLGLGKKLFTETSKYLVNKFYSENQTNEATLFYSLTPNEIPFANQLLGFIPNIKDISIVLLFKENELVKHIASDSLIPDIKKLTSKGYGVGLNITTHSIELTDEIYSLFSYFVYDIRQANELSANVSHKSYVLRKSIEKILRYKGTLILDGVTSREDIELLSLSNISLLSGPDIGEKSKMVLPVSKKTASKLKNIKF